MDFNLSSICDMLSDRIEEYKSTAKKRRIERGLRMYASTPNGVQTTETRQLPTSSDTFPSIMKLPAPSTLKRVTRNLNMKELEDENSKIAESPARFSSITKINSLGTPKRRLLQRGKMNRRRLFNDEDDENNDECLSKYSAEISCADKKKENVEDSVIDTMSQVVTPLYTPKRHRLPRRNMNARKIVFHDPENEDVNMLKSPSNDCEEKLGQIKSSPELFKRINFKDQDMLQSLSNSVETTLIPDEPMDYSTMMVLNVGICIRSTREYVCED